jgi:hypothetical protein
MMMTSRTAQSRTSRDPWSSAGGGRRRDQVSRQDHQFRAANGSLCPAGIRPRWRERS